MKSAEELLATYKSVHLNKKNVQTHFIGVPGIILALMVYLSMMQWPVQMGEVTFKLSVAMIVVPVLIIYYFMLHKQLAIGMVLFILPVLYVSSLIADTENAIIIATVVFVVCWIFQFIGHYFEKAKPAFYDDIAQLLIGPFFLMAEVYFMLGLEEELEQAITPMAIDKRRALGQ